MKTPSENTQFSLIVKSDREPVIFMVTVQTSTAAEWVELMKSYIRKQSLDESLQMEEVMGRLMGKARYFSRSTAESPSSGPPTDCPEQPGKQDG